MHYIKWKFHWYFTIALESKAHQTRRRREKITTTTVIITIESEKYVLCARKNEEEWEMNKENEKKEVWWMNQNFSCSLFVRSDLCGGCACVLCDHRPACPNQSNFSHKICISFFNLLFFLFVSLGFFYAPFTMGFYIVETLKESFSIERIEMIFFCFHLNRFFWFVNWFLL